MLCSSSADERSELLCRSACASMRGSRFLAGAICRRRLRVWRAADPAGTAVSRQAHAGLRAARQGQGQRGHQVIHAFHVANERAAWQCLARLATNEAQSIASSAWSASLAPCGAFECCTSLGHAQGFVYLVMAHEFLHDQRDPASF